MIYKINMSKGDAIFIDENDLNKLEENIGEKLIRLKEGIINPSFMISIVPQVDKKEFKIEPTFEKRENRMVQTGQKKIPTIKDVMNNRKLL